jgi:hypothetical protein
LFGYLWVLLLWPWAVHRLRWDSPALLTAVWKDWVVKGGYWKFSTTISRGMVFQPLSRRHTSVAALTRTEEHERVHVRQSEDLTFVALIVGLVVWAISGSLGLGLGLWLSGPFWQVPFFVTALLRHYYPKPEGDSWWTHIFLNVMYRQSSHERDAYSQTDGWPWAWLYRVRADTHVEE